MIVAAVVFTYFLPTPQKTQLLSKMAQ